MGNTKKKKKRSAAHIIIIAAVIMFSLIVFIITGGFFVIRGYYEKSNYVADPLSLELNSDITIERDAEGKDSDQQLIRQVEEDLIKNAKGSKVSDEEVTNFLLIGTDRREEGWAGNSDAMILVSINRKTEQIIMTSIMRDTYAMIPQYGNGKINLAHALAGAPLLVQAVEENFSIEIDYYATINFADFIEVIDQIGGITLEVREEEIPVANKYVRDMNYDAGNDLDDGIITEQAGEIHLTGKQALGYSRIRYVGNWDYERTERQRKVLMKVIEKVKTMNLLEINSFVSFLLSKITHNVPETDIFAFILEAINIMQYDVISERIPYDGLYQSLVIDGQSVLCPDWEATKEKLHSMIYGN